MTISSEEFRDALRYFSAGVTVVTAGCDSGSGSSSDSSSSVHGMTVSAFSSVSAEPPLVAVFINRGQTLHGLLKAKNAPFGVSFLGEDQVDISNQFAFADSEHRFDAGDWVQGVTGVPVLEDALVWLECTVHERHETGSHILYLGRVVASRVARPAVRPLIYWNRDYHRLIPDGGESP
jgi:flavin reductase (DIM6/NTAB) family NADH-FMN oxidoreductase RutF